MCRLCILQDGLRSNHVATASRGKCNLGRSVPTEVKTSMSAISSPLAAWVILVGIVLFHEPVLPRRLVCIALVVVGIIGLQLQERG